MERLPFYTAELARSNTEPDADALELASELLSSPLIQEEIGKGNVTLAMIRPNVGPEANILGLSDEIASEKIEQMIECLGVMTKFSFTFTPEAAAAFYAGGPQESMSKEPPRNPQKYANRWPEFIDFMASGPTTILLLHSPNGDAIPLWRSHLGHWNIDEVRDPATIRGKLGVNKYNNLVHGSDSPESVIRELSLIAQCIQTQVR